MFMKYNYIDFMEALSTAAEGFSLGEDEAQELQIYIEVNSEWADTMEIKLVESDEHGAARFLISNTKRA